METCNFSDQLSSLSSTTTGTGPNSFWAIQEHYPAVSNRLMHPSSDLIIHQEASAAATNYNGCGFPPPSDVYSHQIPSHGPQIGGGVELGNSGGGFQCSSEVQQGGGGFSGNLGYDYMKGNNQYQYHQRRHVVGEDGNQVVPEYSDAAADPTVCDINLSKSNNRGSWIYDGQGLHISRPRTAASAENGVIRVGKYSVEERKGKILRYLNKRNHRNFNKTIKYACRKTLADRRTRVRGRFAKNNNELYAGDGGGELIKDDGRHHLDEKLSALSTSTSSPDELSDFYNVYDPHEDGEDWLQEAIRCLFYNTTPPHNNIPPWQYDGVAL